MKLKIPYREGTFQCLRDEHDEVFLRIYDPVDDSTGWYLWAPDGWVRPNQSQQELETAFEQMEQK